MLVTIDIPDLEERLRRLKKDDPDAPNNRMWFVGADGSVFIKRHQYHSPCGDYWFNVVGSTLFPLTYEQEQQLRKKIKQKEYNRRFRQKQDPRLKIPACDLLVEAALSTKEDTESLFQDPTFVENIVGIKCKRLHKVVEGE